MAWMPFLGSARDRSGNTGDFTAGKVEELKRIARFFAAAKNAPKMKITAGIPLYLVILKTGMVNLPGNGEEI
jgi:hypothetical protein